MFAIVDTREKSMRPVRGSPSRSNASDELWRNSKATAMVIGRPIVATDAVYAPALVSAISGPTLWRGGVDVTSCPGTLRSMAEF
jgi:hypothetical protein